jgi:hypothetical protein
MSKIAGLPDWRHDLTTRSWTAEVGAMSDHDDLHRPGLRGPPVLLRRSLTGCGWHWLPTWPGLTVPPASTESDLRCYLAWCAELAPGLDQHAQRPGHLVSQLSHLTVTIPCRLQDNNGTAGPDDPRARSHQPSGGIDCLPPRRTQQPWYRRRPSPHPAFGARPELADLHAHSPKRVGSDARGIGREDVDGASGSASPLPPCFRGFGLARA